MALRAKHKHSHRNASTLISPRPARGDFAIAFVAGVLSALFMSLLEWLGISMHQAPYSLEVLLGSVITDSFTWTSWFVGFAWHLLNGGLFALVYAAIFKYIKHSGPSTGALIGIAHWGAAALLLKGLSAIHPLTSTVTTIIGSLLLHLAYGAVLGWLYRAAMRRRPTKVLAGEMEPQPRWENKAS